VVDAGGKTRPAVVGRIKIERRPLMMIAATVEDRTISVLVQNAETIRLTRPDGSAVSVVGLQQGDEILVRVENAGRHFGHAISETIIET
jgi:3-dehydroquinate synthase II